MSRKLRMAFKIVMSFKELIFHHQFTNSLFTLKSSMLKYILHIEKHM